MRLYVGIKETVCMYVLKGLYVVVKRTVYRYWYVVQLNLISIIQILQPVNFEFNTMHSEKVDIP